MFVKELCSFDKPDMFLSVPYGDLLPLPISACALHADRRQGVKLIGQCTETGGYRESKDDKN